MYGTSKKNNYFQDLLDDAKNRSVARGSSKVEWTDVWMAIAKNSETSSVLSDRNVSTTSLATEIEFLAYFRNDEVKDNSQTTYEKVKEIVYSMTEEIRSYQRIRTRHSDEAIEQAINDIVNHIQDSLFNQNIYTTKDEARKDEALKLKIIDMALQTSLQSIISDFRDLFPQADSVDFKDHLAKLVLEGLLSRSWVASDNDTIIENIEKLETESSRQPSPVKVTEYVIEQSGDLYTALLYRNGLRSNDPGREDILERILPNHIVQKTALRALRTANTLNAKKLNERHFAIALLEDPEVRVHLRKLGVLDLIKFGDEFRKYSIEMDEKPESKVSVHTQIPKEIESLINAFNQAYEKKPTNPEILLWLMKNNKQIDTAMNKSGLTRQMLSDWRTRYDAQLEETKAETEVKKGPKISDAEMEKLIKDYCVDLTALAADRKIDPMIGNESVLDQVTTKLTKRGKKNPIIIGEPGIGKTKIFEGLAYAMLRGNAPEELIGGRLLTLDLQKMNSPYRGEFEGRIIALLEGLSERNAIPNTTKTILGIDELAVAQNAGTHSGDQNGFRGLAKPYLTSGDLLMIGTTTQQEYRQQVEKDPAWARRTQPVYMKEPTIEETSEILLKIKRLYSRHHKLRIPDKLVSEIADLTGRYMHTANQPDKSIDTLDEACALAHKERAATLSKDHVLRVISDKTNIPASFLSQNDNQRYAEIEKRVGKHVVGQDEAIKLVSASLKRAKAGFKDPQKPIGNYLFVGPTGVGKTELAKALAEFLMGNDKEFLVRFDMSEYQSSSSVSRLTGSDPGLVGYEAGGSLITAARAKPYAVYLFDEGEKAHPDVFNVLLGAFDNGIVTDGRGITGSLRNSVNIITTNLGAREVMDAGFGRGLDPVKNHAEWQKMAGPIYKKAVESFFKPEFLNRLDAVVYFNSLTPDTMRHLVKRHFKQTASQLKEFYGLELRASQAFLAVAADKGFDVRYGARPLKRTWAEIVETPLADWLLRQNQKDIKRAKVLKMSTSLSMDSPEIAIDSDFDKIELTTHFETAPKVASLETRRLQQITSPNFRLIY